MGGEKTRHVAGRIAQHPGLAGGRILDDRNVPAPVALEQPAAPGLHDLRALVAVEVDAQGSRGIRHVAVEDPPEHSAGVLIEKQRFTRTRVQAGVKRRQAHRLECQLPTWLAAEQPLPQRPRGSHRLWIDWIPVQNKVPVHDLRPP